MKKKWGMKMRKEGNRHGVMDKYDVLMALGVGICLLTVYFFPKLQYSATCFAAMLCMEKKAADSLTAGVKRTFVTIAGSLTGALVVLIDDYTGNAELLILFAMIGIILTMKIASLMQLEKLDGKIGCITFILVIMVASGDARFPYAFWRAVGTAYGAVVALALTIIYGHKFIH